MGVKERKEREFKRREREILEAALHLFTNKGLDSVTIEMIAEEAEIGKGTIYKHFTSKDEIYVSLFIKHSEEVLESIQGIDPELPVVEQVRELIRNTCEICLRTPKEHRVFHQCEQKYNPENLSTELKQKLTAQVEKKLALIGSILQRGIDEKIFIDVPVNYITATGAAMINGVTELLAGSPMNNFIDDPDLLLRLAEDTLIRGMTRN